MSTLQIDSLGAAASSVSVDDLELSVDLADGRTITVPTAWFPRLAHGSQAERANWMISRGHGIHRVESLVTGRRSKESDSSLKKWLKIAKPAESV